MPPGGPCNSPIVLMTDSPLAESDLLSLAGVGHSARSADICPTKTQIISLTCIASPKKRSRLISGGAATPTYASASPSGFGPSELVDRSLASFKVERPSNFAPDLRGFVDFLLLPHCRPRARSTGANHLKTLIVVGRLLLASDHVTARRDQDVV
jgi:hypothetical protein